MKDGALDELKKESLISLRTEFLKYGRFGNPHKRLVSINENKSLILWRDSSNPTEK